MKLYIVRHGRADERDPQRYADDDQRPLTAEGMARFFKASQGLRNLGVELERVISSPVWRARQTAELLMDGLKLPRSKLEFSDALRYDARIQATWELIRRLKQEGDAALVGHEPHLSELIAYLIAGDPGCRVQMKKGACACVASDGTMQPGYLELQWLMTQKQLILVGGE